MKLRTLGSTHMINELVAALGAASISKQTALEVCCIVHIPLVGSAVADLGTPQTHVSAWV